MGAFVGIDLDLREIDKGLDAMGAAGKDLRPLFKDQRKRFRQDQRDHFDKGEGPQAKWPPRSKSMAKRVLGSKKKSRTKTGRLRKSAQKKLNNQLGALKKLISISVRTRRMEVKSKVPWSGVHQTGGTAGRGVTIPKRTFLWISDPFAEQFVKAYAEFVVDAWEASA